MGEISLGPGDLLMTKESSIGLEFSIVPRGESVSNIAVAGKWGPRIESMYSLLKMGDIPASYVSLPEGITIVPFTGTF